MCSLQKLLINIINGSFQLVADQQEGRRLNSSEHKPLSLNLRSQLHGSGVWPPDTLYPCRPTSSDLI